MADNFNCKKCGYKEAEHEIVEMMRLGVPEFLYGKPPYAKKEIEKQVREGYPRICREYTLSSEEKAFRKEEFDE